jgi:hypothetical protein
LKVENAGGSKLSGCKVHLLGIAPQVEYVGPWIVSEEFDLAGGDFQFLPLISYGEAANPRISDYSDTFMEIWPPGPTAPKPSKQGTHQLTLRATAMECEPREFRCSVWVDGDGRLRIEEMS